MSMLNFGYVLGILALIVLTPVLLNSCYLFILTLFSLLPNWRRLSADATAKFAILLPVRNAEDCIEKVVRQLITEQDYPGDLFDVVVIADNCTDSSAFTASFAGANVMEYKNDWKTGKGYALEWAFAELKKQDYDAYLIIDIDTQIDKKALRYLDAELSKGATAMQLSTKMIDAKSSWKKRYLDIVFAGLNHLRPKGRHNLGLSCGITGNGFCFSDTLLDKLPYEAFECVEGLEYHYRMVLKNEKVRFIPRAKVAVKYVSHKRNNIREYEKHRQRIYRKYMPSLLKAALCGNFSAGDCIFSFYTMSLKTILGSLLAVVLTGILMFFSSVSLPECEDLFLLSVWVLLPALFGIIMILCYIFAGMLEQRISLMTWIAVFLYPFYLIKVSFENIKNYLIHN